MNIQLLKADDFDAWLPLWKGYQAFYNVDIASDVTEETWRRFHDADEPVHAAGAKSDEGELLGIVHYIFHRSTWTTDDYVYLQDLFTKKSQRGNGIGRALINHVYEVASNAGSSRVYWLTHETNTAARHLYDRVADNGGFLQYRKTVE